MQRALMGAMVALALLITTSLPALCNPVIEQLLVRRLDAQVNVRVVLVNPAKTKQAGPIVITLYARHTDKDAWQKIKTWNNIAYLKPGNRVARDLFEKNSTLLHDLAAGGAFQVRAVVTAPGVKKAVEKTSVYNSDTGK